MFFDKFFGKKPRVIKFEQNLCNASVDDNDVLFVRVRGEVESQGDMIEVPYTHKAYIIKGGGDARLYDSGNYPVFDDNSEVKSWRAGFSVDIVYIPKETSIAIAWGTPNRITYRDKASNRVVNVGAHGQFRICVTRPEQFFRKVVGNKKEFDRFDFEEHFRAEVVSEFTQCFLDVVADQKLTYDQFDAKKKSIGDAVGKILSDKFSQSWGIGLENFIIETVGITAEDSAAVENAAAEVQKQNRLKEYLAEIERLDDKQWEREKYLRNLELADKNAYYDVLKVIGNKPESSVSAGKTFCTNCGQPLGVGAAFCAACGCKAVDAKPVCPKCHSAAEKDSAFCSKCGEKL